MVVLLVVEIHSGPKPLLGIVQSHCHIRRQNNIAKKVFAFRTGYLLG